MSCFVFRSRFQGLSFKGGEKLRAAAGAREEPLLLGGSRARRGWAVPPADEAGFGALSLRVLVKLMSVFSFARN